MIPALTRRAFLMIGSYLVVLLLYVSFFAYPVSAASPSASFAFTLDSKEYSSFPSIHESIYTDGKAFVAIATIRTISIPSAAFSMAFDRLDRYAEDYVREQYGMDIEIEIESDGERYDIAGHTATRFVYGIFDEVVIGFPPFQHVETVKVAEMTALAWFCNVDFESVIVIHITPFYFVDDPSLESLASLTVELVDSISCH